MLEDGIEVGGRVEQLSKIAAVSQAGVRGTEKKSTAVKSTSDAASWGGPCLPSLATLLHSLAQG